jgi:hypothetical protein
MRAYPDPARTLKNRTKTIRLFCTVSARHTLPESDLIRFWRFPLHDPRWILFTGLQFMPGTLKMKFDPCGDDAAMAERVSETLGSMTFGFTKHSTTIAANEPMSSSGGLTATVEINLLSPSSRSGPRNGCQASDSGGSCAQGPICTKRSAIGRVMPCDCEVVSCPLEFS